MLGSWQMNPYSNSICRVFANSKVAKSASIRFRGLPPDRATTRISALIAFCPTAYRAKASAYQLSHFWFDQTESMVANHRLARATDALPAVVQPFNAVLARRSMLVKKGQPLAIECVVRATWRARAGRNIRRSRPCAASSCRRACWNPLNCRNPFSRRHQGRIWPRRKHHLFQRRPNRGR